MHVYVLRKAERERKKERESSFGRDWRCNTKALAGPLVKHWGLLLGYILINTLVCRLSSHTFLGVHPLIHCSIFESSQVCSKLGDPKPLCWLLMLTKCPVHSEEMCSDHFHLDFFFKHFHSGVCCYSIFFCCLLQPFLVYNNVFARSFSNFGFFFSLCTADQKQNRDSSDHC